MSSAIVLGERSVHLDPTDAEAWLILAAAYVQSGGDEGAHQCYASCVKLATHGPRRECAALAR